MTKNFLKLAFFLSVCLFTSNFLLAQTIQENAARVGEQANYVDVASEGDLMQGKLSLTLIIAQILKFALSLLGVVFVVLIIHAGSLWMLAGDKSDQIDAAKTKIKNATIGLIIIIMAYALTYFVIEKLVEETLGRF